MASTAAKACFNSNCKEVPENCRRGWRRRTGDYANLCDSCASAYEDGKFCETFHVNDPGWRCCESCGKKIHCGCIVSFHMFVLLDAGGIECLTCARKSYILTPNPAWPPPSHFLPSLPERMKDYSLNSWRVAGSGSLPWRQAPSLLRHSDFESDVQTKAPFDFDVCGVDRLPSCEKKQGALYEKLPNGNLKISPSKIRGNFGLDMKEHPKFLEKSSKSVFATNDSFDSNLCFTTIAQPECEKHDLQFSAVLQQKRLISSPTGKWGSHLDACGGGEMLRGNDGGHGFSQNMFHAHCHPQITEKGLRNKAVATPLFEKMLSASDAGRIGRLVLPKKCAEAYFPPISCPEGLPIKVMDVKGKEWVFQFRYWPNNNSRMYVLEGITPCIQSLQLQAGDIVMFSRLEPEGKLILGGRKTSAIYSVEQGAECTTASSKTVSPCDASVRNKSGVAFSMNGHVREKLVEGDTLIHTKRKNTNSHPKNKRLRMVADATVELRFTLKEAQRLIRPHTKGASFISVVEGYEFEEFEEDALVIGRPTVPGIDHSGEDIQWVQCEECSKWSKVPADALLHSRWICSENTWDSRRSSCSAAEELPSELLEQILRTMEKDYPVSEGNSNASFPLERLDELANLAILGERDCVPASSGKHSYHKSSCTPITCHHHQLKELPKHKESCDCLVCSSSRYQSKAREKKKHCEGGAGAEPSSSSGFKDGNSGLVLEVKRRSELLDQEVGKRPPSSPPPLKNQIDLNIKPDREEEVWPGAYS